MGETLPTQHPAVVLRSHFNALRALLAVALVAVVGLTVAVVILASDEQQVNSAKPETINPVADMPDGIQSQTLPPGTRRGNNINAFLGGFRLWDKRKRGARIADSQVQPSEA